MDVLKEFWAIILAAVAAVAWLVRLEARGLDNARELRRVWLQRKEDLDAAKEARQQTAEMLNEIRADVKALLRHRPD